jgi:hypothetical protein
VIPEQSHPALFDRWQALVTPVTDDEDRYLSYLVRPGAGCSERTAKVGKHLAGLDSQVTGTDEVAVLVFRLALPACVLSTPKLSSATIHVYVSM